MRDAVNVGVVALEELGADDDALEFNEPQRSRAVAAQRPVTFVEKAAPERLVSDDQRATTAQVRAIYAIARNQHGLGEPQTDERCQSLYGCTPAELSKRQASDFITTLQTADQAVR